MAYSRFDLSTEQNQIVKWSNADHAEVPITSLSTEDWGVDQWSPDGRSLLVTHSVGKQRTEIWQIPLDAHPAGESTPRKLISDPSLDLFQAQFSPDGKWISFLAVNEKPDVRELTIYVTPSAGGKWIRITDGKHWDDIPRWSPDGKIIYFVSNRAGFFNVWGLHFDPLKGQAIGDAFQVTSFNRPNLMVLNDIQWVGFSLGLNRLAITTEEASGSIWILNHVDP